MDKSWQIRHQHILVRAKQNRSKIFIATVHLSYKVKVLMPTQLACRYIGRQGLVWSPSVRSQVYLPKEIWNTKWVEGKYTCEASVAEIIGRGAERERINGKEKRGGKCLMRSIARWHIVCRMSPMDDGQTVPEKGSMLIETCVHQIKVLNKSWQETIS